MDKQTDRQIVRQTDRQLDTSRNHSSQPQKLPIAFLSKRKMWFRCTHIGSETTWLSHQLQHSQVTTDLGLTNIQELDYYHVLAVDAKLICCFIMTGHRKCSSIYIYIYCLQCKFISTHVYIYIYIYTCVFNNHMLLVCMYIYMYISMSFQCLLNTLCTKFVSVPKYWNAIA